MSNSDDLHFKGNYLKKSNNNTIRMIKCCDGPDCEITDNLKKYPTDLGYTLTFCNFHVGNPYNVLSESILDIELPTFHRNGYIMTNQGKTVCGFRGCSEESGLKYMFHDYFCPKHCKDMMNIQAKYVEKYDSIGILINKIKEFNYRKILNKKNLNDILRLSEHTKTNYFKTSMNLIHYQYAYNNLVNTEGLTDLRKNLNRNKSYTSNESSDSGERSSLTNSTELTNSRQFESPNSRQFGSPVIARNLSGSGKGKAHSDERRNSPPPRLNRSTPDVTYKPIDIQEFKKNYSFVNDSSFKGSLYTYFSVDPATFLRNPNMKM